jgi:L,D-peptidoglycan transpeptidase YkuD (ErfK/YbiS/YcfS/YnhG family)
MHVARDEETPGNTPTAGCIALSQKDLLEILKEADENTGVTIFPDTSEGK